MALERFKSEIRLARRIAHRNVVRTYDLGENSGVYFITMEFVEGKSLKELIVSRGRLPAPSRSGLGAHRPIRPASPAGRCRPRRRCR